MPRRKYGHMVGPCPPVSVEKCHPCRLGYPCPLHRPAERPDYKMVAKNKRRKYSGKKRYKK